MLIAVHIGIVRRHGVTEFRFAGEPDDRPRHVNFDHEGCRARPGAAMMATD